MKLCLRLTFSSVLLASFLASCASTQKADSSSPETNLENSQGDSPEKGVDDIDLSQAVPIQMPELKKLSYFSFVDQKALTLVEVGSPESLQGAWEILRRNDNSYEEYEKTLIYVAASIMKMAWPSAAGKFYLSAPEPQEENLYTGAVKSAASGLYDTSSGNSDFLTLTLPSLVLLTSNSSNSYYQQAGQSLDKALTLQPDSVLARYLRGLLYERQGDYSRADIEYLKAAEKSPKNLELWLAMARNALRGGDPAKALELGKTILSQPENSMNLTATSICARAAFDVGKFDEAEGYVAKVLQQNPNNPEFILFRAKILILKNDYIRASSLLDVYARSDDSSKDYLLLRSRIQKEWNRNTTAAAVTLERALSLYPNDGDVLAAAAEVASATGKTIGGKNAVDFVSQILASDPENSEALKILTDEYIKQRDWKKAYGTSSKLAEKKNASRQQIFTHISICLEAGEKNEAWRLASALYREDSADEDVLKCYLSVLVATDRNNEAKKLIESNLSKSPSSQMRSFYYYERSFLVSGEDQILSNLRSSLTANPRNKDALFRMYKIYYAKKEYRKARYYLKQVVAISPNDQGLLKLNQELDSLLGL